MCAGDLNQGQPGAKLVPYLLHYLSDPQREMFKVVSNEENIKMQIKDREIVQGLWCLPCTPMMPVRIPGTTYGPPSTSRITPNVEAGRVPVYLQVRLNPQNKETKAK